MKKLYIPTTTLNFNNILSSESISPESFYFKRDFGYSRWFPIPENDNVNAILLYDSKRYFERPLSDIEDHPLLIEVMVDESKLSKYAEGVYYCDHTIYLDPWHTKFIFFSPNDKTITLSMSDSSLETKSIKLYQRKIFVDSPSQKYSAVRFQNINLNILEIEKDFRINRMKGFLYGYYIGALLSTDKESVNRLSDLKEILNIFAAIASSIEKKPTSYQSERLDVLLKSVLYDLPLYQELLDIQEYNSPIDWINNKINKQELKKKKNFLYPNASEVVVIDNELEKAAIVEDSFEQKLYKNWINTILTSNKYNGNINSIREELSDDITIKAKEIYGEKWDESNTKIILNKLRRHVRGDNFDVEWNNGLLSSIAAVITNGSDWTKLLAFMQNHGMYDYRLAFSMYGALNGFANLSRDFTDVLFSCDSRYVAEVYTEFYGQLFGATLDTKVINEEKRIGDGDSFDNASEFISFMESICKGCKSAKKDETIYMKYFSQYGLSIGLWDAIRKDTSLQNGKGAQKAVIKCIEKLINRPTEKKKEKIVSPSLFQEDNCTSTHIIGFEEAVTFIQNKTPEQIRNNLIENLKYIDKEYTGYGKYVNTGDDPVKHFLHLCFSMSNKWNRIEETSENRKYVEQICKILSGNRQVIN